MYQILVEKNGSWYASVKNRREFPAIKGSPLGRGCNPIPAIKDLFYRIRIESGFSINFTDCTFITYDDKYKIVPFSTHN